MTKKRWFTPLALIAVLGAVLVVSQIVWADDSVKKQEPAQVSQTDHAAHHPEAQATENATVSAKAEPSSSQTMMKDGNMQDMMKTMTDGNMNDIMKDSSMQDMMKMMDTPEGKQMVELCQKLLKQNAENKTTVQ